MDFLRQYVLSIVAASIISGIVMGFMHGGTVKQLLKLVCGLFLAFMVIAPVRQLEPGDFFSKEEIEASIGKDIAHMGEEMAEQAMADIIKAETEAYILDKAMELDVSLEVQVTVSDEGLPVPVEARLHGKISPYVRQQLEGILSRELGIPKEQQIWTG